MSNIKWVKLGAHYPGVRPGRPGRASGPDARVVCTELKLRSELRDEHQNKLKKVGWEIWQLTDNIIVDQQPPASRRLHGVADCDRSKVYRVGIWISSRSETCAAVDNRSPNGVGLHIGVSTHLYRVSQNKTPQHENRHICVMP